MISYCVCVLRPRLFYILLEDLIRKTSVPYEILVWLNTRAPDLERYIERMAQRGIPVRMVGCSPDNVGMVGYKVLFQSAKYDLITQVHDDVVCISRGIAEEATEIFKAHPTVKQIVADVVQDAFTTGGKPGPDAYTVVDEASALVQGPIDGWFSIYHKSILQILKDAPYTKYFYLGSYVQMQLRARKLEGYLCTRMKVFHLAGPAYAQLMDTVGVEVKKYEFLDKPGQAAQYAELKVPSTVLEQMASEYRKNVENLEKFGKGS